MSSYLLDKYFDDFIGSWYILTVKWKLLSISESAYFYSFAIFT